MAAAAASEAVNSESSVQTDETDTIFNDKLTVELKRRFRKAKWLMITNIYDILSNYGTIYGGAVRDYIIRKNAADEYYAYCKDKGINADKNYLNKEVHPSTFNDRLLIPKDVDVFITRKNMTSFIERIKPMCYMEKKSHRPLTYCFDSSELLCKALTLEKWTLKIINLGYSFVNKIIFGHHIKKNFFTLSIDFVIINDDFLKHEEYLNKGVLHPPFGNPDFDVNLLSFTKDSECNLKITPLPYLEKLAVLPHDSVHTGLEVAISDKIRKKILEQIITNIKNDCARPIVPIKEQYVKVFGKDKIMGTKDYRIFKMQYKYFKLDIYNPILPSDIITTCKATTIEYAEDDVCAICRELFSDTDRAFRACNDCPRKVHLLCLRDFLNKSYASNIASHTCPGCEDCGALNFTNGFYCNSTIDVLNFLINFVSYHIYRHNRDWFECLCKRCRKNYNRDSKECVCWEPITPKYSSSTQLDTPHS
jgi:hypothetical protein